jgi:hypothetical protein
VSRGAGDPDDGTRLGDLRARAAQDGQDGQDGQDALAADHPDRLDRLALVNEDGAGRPLRLSYAAGGEKN